MNEDKIFLRRKKAAFALMAKAALKFIPAG